MKHFFCLLISGVLLCSCLDILQSKQLQVRVPDIPASHKWRGQKHWTLYFIQKDARIGTAKIPKNSSVKIEIYKQQNAPLLACLEYEELINLESARDPGTLHLHCSFAAGAIDPYDTSSATITLKFGATAQVAEILLLLYVRGANIELLNDRKLLTTIESKLDGQPLQKKEILQDLASNTFSYWSIKEKEAYTVTLDNVQDHWHSNSLHIPNFSSETKTLPLYYPGTWYFINTRTGSVVYFILSREGKLFSNFF